MLVWYCAEQCHPGVKFQSYAILGDDIVIADDDVAREYSSLLSKLGVDISISKSLISRSGACEYAKRFLLNRCRDDVSPVSIKKLLTTLNPIGWYNFMLTADRPLRVSTRLVASALRRHRAR